MDQETEGIGKRNGIKGKRRRGDLINF